MANLQTATLAGGCFWCLEKIFQEVKGVTEVASGYSGGSVPSPSYEQVCSGTTGHAEAVQIEFDPAVISYQELLTIFFHLHDPTTLNRQGNDIGTQYRSAIFYHNEEQKQLAEAVKQQIATTKLWSDPIVTEIVPLPDFYPAEAYHQNYYNNHPNQAYCQLVINPKLAKFRQEFKRYLKQNPASKAGLEF